MPEPQDTLAKNPFFALRPFARRAAQRAEEHCDLCGETIGPEHRHLLNLASREILCACQACSILFDRAEAGAGARKLVPTRRRHLLDFEITDAEWESLRVPVNIAFFCYNSSAQRMMAYYPGAMGITESLLSLETWEELEARNPLLKQMEPDVEALLVNRVRDARDYLTVPLDECFRLAGTIRLHWKGLSGGPDVWREIARYFDDLKARSRPTGGGDA